MNDRRSFSVLASFRLDGDTAIVTGGGKGLGRIACLALAEAGAKIAVLDLNEATVQQTVGEISEAGGEARAWVCDVTDEGAVIETFAAIVDAFGGIDILVNNAGIARRDPTESMPTETWDLVIAINQTAVFTCSREAGKHMLVKGKGAIINIASIMGLSGGGFYPNLPYHASKGAVVNMTRALAAEWAQRGVRVNAIGPTFTETDLTVPLRTNNQAKTFIEERTPMGRFAQPEEMAGAILYLASDAASAVTGITLPVDCGWLAI
ncbi:MAG: SDR family oxidoreductase [Alphaproteobacteria bacterium]|nr:SDR family oxidoreductase [Alphaproteobacteria bacterium]